MPGINIEYASNIVFDNCNLKNINTTAIAINNYSYNVDIKNCDFNSIGGTAVRIGTVNEITQATQKDQRKLATDFSNVYTVQTGTDGLNYMPCKINIEKNKFEDISNEYLMSVGVGIFFANTVNVKNNTISNTAYSGISAGWGWVNSKNDYITRKSGNINIEANKLTGVMKKLADGSGIYTLRII